MNIWLAADILQNIIMPTKKTANMPFFCYSHVMPSWLPDHPAANHQHLERQEIVLIVTGSAEILMEDRQYKLQAGDVLQFPALVREARLKSGFSSLTI
ncbi:cupin domain-containing protein [Paenibacillus dokdonensis]|uniref:cupin domain-containing protein n=1 Tax=Paenibacillus dokdonensis TaxID=2567944 RepID=UPI0010A8C168|nr:cupin domain-containing protein [Paenibacillus dokdonensis]